MEFHNDKNLLGGKGEKDIEWITVNGAHIPIHKGQTKKEAVQKFSAELLKNKTKNSIVILPKQEYAEFCSAIRTKYGNKIPKSGGLLYKNDFYVYNYNKRIERIVCTFKIEIVGNERFIDYLEKYDGE